MTPNVPHPPFTETPDESPARGDATETSGHTSFENLVRDLSRPAAHPGRDAARVDRIETHVSVLFLTERHVLKLKKPVHLPFVDQSTAAMRRSACEAELRLNRRTSPTMYLGLRAIRSGADGHAYVDTGALLEEGGATCGDVNSERPGRIAASGDAGLHPLLDPQIDVAVEMVRLPADQMLDVRLARDDVADADLRALCELLADFHSRADASPAVAEHGRPGRVRHKLLENLDQLAREALPHPKRIAREHLDALRAFFEDRCAEQANLLGRRWRGGFVREGHGDLHAGNVCLASKGIQVYDCVEFDIDLRADDVACDVAFLVMDLCHRDHAEAGERIVELYAQAASDPDLPQLVPLYAVHRALIRAKVELFAAHQHTGPASAEHVRMARRYVQLALAWSLGPGAVVLDTKTSRDTELVRELERVQRTRLGPVGRGPDRRRTGLFMADDRDGATLERPFRLVATGRDGSVEPRGLDPGPTGSTGSASQSTASQSTASQSTVSASKVSASKVSARHGGSGGDAYTLAVGADEDSLDVIDRLLSARHDARRN